LGWVAHGGQCGPPALFEFSSLDLETPGRWTVQTLIRAAHPSFTGAVRVVHGLSFIIRAHNEERHLAASLNSIKEVSLPFEVIVVLDRCTDGSRQVVESLDLPIKIYERERPVSRAGYETVVTPVEHPCSIASFLSFSFSRARFDWRIKWDADFIASTELIEALNGLRDIKEPTVVNINCVLGGNVKNKESYLFNCLQSYTHHVFWEAPRFPSNVQLIEWDDDVCINSLPVDKVKDYWREDPWFTQPDFFDDELSHRYEKLVSVLGPEPKGMARAGNPDCDEYYFKVVNLDLETLWKEP
jgi:glycosyltransferase involved in cell wall biosynthesis